MVNISIFQESDYEAVREIFFLSSSIKEFSSIERKEAFIKRWCTDYMTYYPEYFFVLREENSNRVLGYLSGCPDSTQSLEKLEVPGLECFKDQFLQYPAHLHINFHPDCRGKGLGSVLVDYFCQELGEQNIKGVHLVTSPDAANINFYKRLGFSDQVDREFGKMHLLFMGKILC